VNREEYYPFGGTSFGSYAKKRYRYNGKEKDEESGLYYYGARYYATWTLRFYSTDPQAPSTVHQSSYCYADNNPIMFQDINGESTGGEGGPKPHRSEHIGKKTNHTTEKLMPGDKGLEKNAMNFFYPNEEGSKHAGSYTVTRGSFDCEDTYDTLEGIARRFVGVTKKDILEANPYKGRDGNDIQVGIDNEHHIEEGQVLNIPYVTEKSLEREFSQAKTSEEKKQIIYDLFPNRDSEKKVRAPTWLEKKIMEHIDPKEVEELAEVFGPETMPSLNDNSVFGTYEKEGGSGGGGIPRPTEFKNDRINVIHKAVHQNPYREYADTLLHKYKPPGLFSKSGSVNPYPERLSTKEDLRNYKTIEWRSNQHEIANKFRNKK